MLSPVLFALFLAATVSHALAENLGETFVALEPNNKGKGSGTTGFEIAKGYQFGAHLNHKGVPSGTFSLYGSGKLGEGKLQNPPEREVYHYPAVEATGPPPPQYYVQPGLSSSSLWSYGAPTNFLTAGLYVAGGVALAYALVYLCGVTGFAKKSLDDLEDVKSTKEKEKDDKAKTRRRRALEADENLTNLASMVLAAIESGECLQKSLCIMGAQVGSGTGKGHLAASLLDKMIPINMQSNVYFLTFRNALRGQAYCAKMRCNH